MLFGWLVFDHVDISELIAARALAYKTITHEVKYICGIGRKILVREAAAAKKKKHMFYFRPTLQE